MDDEQRDRDQAMLYKPGDRYADITSRYRRPWRFGPFKGEVWVTRTFRIYEQPLAKLGVTELAIADINAKYSGARQYVLVGMLLIGNEAMYQTLDTLERIVKTHYSLNYPKPLAAVTPSQSPPPPSSDGSAPRPSTSDEEMLPTT